MFIDIYEELCKKAGKKPYTVAKEIGLGSSNVAQWKKGSTPRPEVLQKLSDYFGVSQAELLGLKLDNEKSPTPDGVELDPVTQELFDIVNSSDEDELKTLLEMARLIKKRRN